jgi:crossover junction endodeoxyribonuclease RuvC
MPETMRIVGIDPALRRTGYAVIDSDGNTHHALDCGVISTPAGRPLSECLRRLHGGIHEIIAAYKPAMAAIEGGFYSRNAKTAMLLGCARGTVIAAFAMAGIPVFEYAPRRVKQAISGYGDAEKEQIASLMGSLFSIDVDGLPRDATDALAIAVCHSHTQFTNQGIFLPKPL